MYFLRLLFSLLRAHQYIKNLFVFVGVLFSNHWEVGFLSNAALVFVSFCLMASAVYILNDLHDIEFDRLHPEKKNRPIPSGRISFLQAICLLCVLFLTSVIVANHVGLWVLGFVCAYFFLNVLYCRWFKHVVILDVFVISSGFMLRILAGTVGLGILASEWLLLCGFMITLFLGFTKRYSEINLSIMENHSETNTFTRKVLDDYSVRLLDQFISVTAACTILAYGMYTVAPQTISLHGSSDLIFTLPLVVYGIFRYLFLVYQRSSGNDAAKEILQDWHMLMVSLSWGISVLIILT
jgi:4-hydroxybenzoate polyprenyltransferase